jgi:hypothetical protein
MFVAYVDLARTGCLSEPEIQMAFASPAAECFYETGKVKCRIRDLAEKGGQSRSLNTTAPPFQIGRVGCGG